MENMVDLNIESLKQTEKFPCGPNSLYMVLKYLNINIKKEDVLRRFKEKTKKIDRVIMPIIAEIAIDIGLNPLLIITNYSYFPAKLDNMANKELLSYIDNRINSKEEFVNLEDKEYYKAVKNLIQKGGRVKFRLFTQKDIEDSILNKKPCICQINTASFSKKDIDYRRQHFVVVKGCTGREFILNIGHEEAVKKDKKDFLFSLYRTKIPNLLLF